MDELLTRAVSAVYPSTEELSKVLASGKKLRIYFGIDPTGPDVHLGHAVPLRKLREFQDLGHQAILLIGDFTAMIGDPTDKSAARVPLSVEQVKANMANYLDQAGKILNLDKTEVRYNSEWLAKLSPVDFLELASNLTVGQLLKREMFQKRMIEGKEVFFHELFYPMMQGYDSVALDVDMEIGGNDQIFNMLVGRDLLKKMRGKEKFVLATKLLAAPGEAKMSKTEGNMIMLGDEPAIMYGKVMSWPDTILPLAFELLTNTEFSPSAHPRDEKMRLAREIVNVYHGAEAARAAEADFVAKFQKKEIPEDLPELRASAGESLADILVRGEILSSKSEFRRLLEEGAIEDLDAGTITDPHFAVKKKMRLRVGKKHFLQILI